MEVINKDSVILRMAKKTKRLNVEALAKKAILNNKQDLIDLNTDMLRQGKNEDGNNEIYQSLDYAEYKKELPTYFAPYPTVDLYNTGDYQAKKILKIEGSNVSFPSTDTKNDDLTDRYGEGIEGLNPKSMELARDIVTPDFNKYLHELLR